MTLPPDFLLPTGFRDPQWCMPGVLAITGPSIAEAKSSVRWERSDIAALVEGWEARIPKSNSIEEDGEDAIPMNDFREAAGWSPIAAGDHRR